MGLFCVNFHFRGADDRALSQALNRRGSRSTALFPAKAAGLHSMKNRRLSKTTGASASSPAVSPKS
jgi:hypothetical protein